MATNDRLQDKLIGYLEDAYALERQIEQVLQKMADQAEGHDAIRQKLLQHMAETQTQAKRMQERLEHYGKEPSAIKTAVGTMQGNLVGMTAGLRGDTLSRNIRDAYVTEHLEIAGYNLMIATARLLNDEATVRAAELTLREEIAMQEWCAQHMVQALFMDFRGAGLDVPLTANLGREGAAFNVTFVPGAEMGTKMT